MIEDAPPKVLAEFENALDDYITHYLDDLRTFVKSQSDKTKAGGGGNPCHDPDTGEFCEGEGGDGQYTARPAGEGGKKHPVEVIAEKWHKLGSKLKPEWPNGASGMVSVRFPGATHEQGKAIMQQSGFVQKGETGTRFGGAYTEYTHPDGHEGSVQSVRGRRGSPAATILAARVQQVGFGPPDLSKPGGSFFGGKPTGGSGKPVSGPGRFAKKPKKDWDNAVKADGGGNPCHDPDTGQFCEGEGGDGDGGKHPGAGYSSHAKLRADGSIYTTDVHDAARALYEGKKVELDQPKKISTLISVLGKEAERWQAQGQKAPLFDLCNVSVAGTNLFCAESKGIPRVKMPQLNAEQTKKFLEYLRGKGYKIDRGKEVAANLRATQNQLDGAKVAINMDKIDSEKGKDPRLVISKDDYILDGHHRWAAKLGVDSRDGNLSNDTKMKISRVNISITKLLEEAEKFTGGKGHVAAGERSIKMLFHTYEAPEDDIGGSNAGPETT